MHPGNDPDARDADISPVLRLSHEVIAGTLSRRAFLGRAAALGIGSLVAESILSTRVALAGPVKGGTLKAGMEGGSDTDSLDPALWNSQVPGTFGWQWGEGLVGLSPNGTVEPLVATEFSSSRDARTWTFKIRKDVTFHNGKTVTAADVIATLERHAAPSSVSPAKVLLSGIDRLRADGDAVIIMLKEPNADLPYLLADVHLMIQPDGGTKDPAAGIGCGPYKVVVNEPGLRHVGEKHADYWNPDKGHADTIEIIVINDSAARLAALQSGSVDMINRIEPKVADLLKQDPAFVLRSAAGRGHYVLAAHCNTAPFSNADLRMALKLAVDRQAMLKTVLGGHGSIGNDFPINAAYPLYPAGIEQRTYDPDRAGFHWRKSGFAEAVVLRTSDVAFPGAVDAAVLFQESAAKAGIPLEIRREPGDSYWSDVWNKKPFSMSYWGGRPTQDQMYSTAYYSKSPWNETRFSNERFDRLLLEARSELDADKRRVLYHEMALIVHHEGGVICPMFNDYLDATSRSVQGWVDDPNSELSGGLALSRCWLAA